MSNYTQLKELAYSGNEEVVCVYIDIKTAMNKLPHQYRSALVQALIYDNTNISSETIDRGIEFLEDILNGR